MDDGGSPYIGPLILLLLVVMHAVFYGFLAALKHQNEGELEKMAQEDATNAALLLRFVQKPADGVHMIRFMVTGMNLLAGAYVLAAYPGLIRIGYFLLYWIAVVIFGIYVPTKIASARAERWGLKLCGLIRIISVLAGPFVMACRFVADLLVRLCGVDPHALADDVTEEEIKSMVNEGHEQVVLLASEAEMINNIFEFDEKEAKDIMTHRKNILALDGNLLFSEALRQITQSPNSRFPVYIDDIDNIIGILHIKEALQFASDPNYYDMPIAKIQDLIRKVTFIPETRNINSLFREMQSEKNHMVVVVDEYGQTAGIVAMEDILEEIVGNILDEHDEDEVMIQKQIDGSYLMNGMADFEEVAKVLDIPVLQDDSYETLNGFLISKIDKIPNEDDRISVTADGYSFHILKVENKMIQKVAVTKLPEENVTEESGNSSCQESEKMLK